MKEANFLTIGTVCRLEGGQKNIMIIGFCPVAEVPEKKMYDYCGCVYPEGVLSSDLNLVFDHSQIEEVLYPGYESEENTNFKQQLNDLLKNQEKSFKEYKPSILNELEKNEKQEDTIEAEQTAPITNEPVLPVQEPSVVTPSAVQQTPVQEQPVSQANSNPMDLFSQLPKYPSVDMNNNN